MNKDFDFDDIGKKMPYKTPDFFFDDNRSKILERTCGKELKKKRILKRLLPATLVAAAILIGWLFFPFAPQETAIENVVPASAIMLASGADDSSTTEAMDVFIENLSDEELQELAEQSENDMFLF